MEIRQIGVVGAGTMGHGIAQIAAQAGYEVLLYDTSEEALAKAVQKITASLSKFVEKGHMTVEERDEVLSRMSAVLDLSQFRDVDLMIEAVYEDFNVKAELFCALDLIAKPECIFATNTSSIPISLLAAVTKRRDRFLGMHFMNPPQLVSLFELIRGRRTSDETVLIARQVAQRMGRDPIIESKDRAGFVENRILMRAINEAARLVEEGTATKEDVNKSVIVGVGSSKGMPILQLADLIGIDICVDVLLVLEERLGHEYAPAGILIDMKEKGLLGRKTGRGFFSYSE